MSACVRRVRRPYPERDRTAGRRIERSEIDGRKKVGRRIERSEIDGRKNGKNGVIANVLRMAMGRVCVHCVELSFTKRGDGVKK